MAVLVVLAILNFEFICSLKLLVWSPVGCTQVPAMYWLDKFIHRTPEDSWYLRTTGAPYLIKHDTVYIGGYNNNQYSPCLLFGNAFYYNKTGRGIKKFTQLKHPPSNEHAVKFIVRYTFRKNGKPFRFIYRLSNKLLYNDKFQVYRWCRRYKVYQWDANLNMVVKYSNYD